GWGLSRWVSAAWVGPGTPCWLRPGLKDPGLPLGRKPTQAGSRPRSAAFWDADGEQPVKSATSIQGRARWEGHFLQVIQPLQTSYTLPTHTERILLMT